jgi:hypothetical protein
MIVMLPPNAYLRGPLEVSLAEALELKVDLLGPEVLSLVAAGDRVRGRGIAIGPNMAAMLEVVIEKVGILGEKPAGTGREDSRDRASRRPGPPPKRTQRDSAEPPAAKMQDSPAREDGKKLPDAEAHRPSEISAEPQAADETEGGSSGEDAEDKEN